MYINIDFELLLDIGYTSTIRKDHRTSLNPSKNAEVCSSIPLVIRH